MFTHDSIKGTGGYSTTQYKRSAVSILVQNALFSDTVFTSRKCLRAS